MTNIVYFSKMFQAVPHLAQVEARLPGIFVSNRRTTLNAAQRLYPDLPTARYSRLMGRLTSGYRLLARLRRLTQRLLADLRRGQIPSLGSMRSRAVLSASARRPTSSAATHIGLWHNARSSGKPLFAFATAKT